MFIVSANYRDRSKKNWLMRPATKPPEEATEHSTLVLGSVEFGPSTEYEEGFGCSIVATAARHIDAGMPRPETAKELTFHKDRFCVADQADEIEKTDLLFLEKDGKMFIA